MNQPMITKELNKQKPSPIRSTLDISRLHYPPHYPRHVIESLIAQRHLICKHMMYLATDKFISSLREFCEDSAIFDRTIASAVLSDTGGVVGVSPEKAALQKGGRSPLIRRCDIIMGPDPRCRENAAIDGGCR
jgi:hypothetical protein